MDWIPTDHQNCAETVQEKDPLIDRRETSVSGSSSYGEDNGEFIKQTYRVRWFVLAMFFFLSAINNGIWITFSPFAIITECYYGVSLAWVNAFSTASMATFVVGVLPIAWFVGRYGVRVTVIFCCCLNAAGAWLRFAAIGPEYFFLMLVGQTLTYIPYVMQSTVPSMVSSIWFPSSERVIATAAIAAIPAQVGVLLSLLVGPFVIQSSNTEHVCNSNVSRSSAAFLDWQTTINNQLFYYILVQALLAFILVPLAFLVPNAPPTPPSLSKHLEISGQKTSNVAYIHWLFATIKNHHFVMFTITYGIYIGASASLSTVYDQVLNKAGYNQYQKDMGFIGLGSQGISILGLIAMGRWIDRTKTFYVSSLGICLTTLIAAVGYSFAVQFSAPFYAVCIMVSLTSGLSSLLAAIGYEYSVEMTYPIPASVSAALLAFSTQVIGIVVVEVVGVMVDHHLAVYVNWLLTGLLLLACLVVVFVRPELRRVKLDSHCTNIGTSSNQKTSKITDIQNT